MSLHAARTAVRILVAEEEPEVRNLVGLVLKHQGYSADFAEDADDAILRMSELPGRYAGIIVGRLMNGSVIRLIDEARNTDPRVSVIMMADGSTEPVPLHGADEIIVKPVNGEALRNAIQRCLRIQQQYRYRPDNTADPAACGPAPSSSLWRAETQAMVRHVAAADVPVLIQGETGVGKEVLARQLHALSPRAKKPFLKVNCTALPSELIESELFGYERGAFTGAFKNTPGKFEMADGGVILLDEIGDMDFKLQAKLLQVLQDFEFIRLGSSEPRRVDVRVIAATHCDLERAIAEGRFREDLYYRLNIVTLNVPALRDRKDEILPLAYHFMRKHATATTPILDITAELRETLLTHEWPGNIRELENVIRKLLVIRRSDVVVDELRRTVRRRMAAAVLKAVPADVPTEPGRRVNREPAVTADDANLVAFITPQDEQKSNRTASIQSGSNRSAPVRTLPRPAMPVTIDEPDQWSVLERVDQARREAETDAIIAALNTTLWNRRRAAEILHIDYKALLYKMKKLGIVERATTQVAI